MQIQSNVRGTYKNVASMVERAGSIEIGENVQCITYHDGSAPIENLTYIIMDTTTATNDGHIIDGSGNHDLGNDKCAVLISKTLAKYGAQEGLDSTIAVTRFINSIKDGEDAVIDVNCIYAGSTSLTCNHSDITFRTINDSVITTPNIDYTTNSPFIRCSGTIKGSLTLTSDISRGTNYAQFDDVSNVEVGDLVKIVTDIYFNGIAAVSGFAPIDKQETMRVRKVSGTTVFFDGGFVFDMPVANIVSITVSKPVNKVLFIGVKLDGPGVQDTLSNGTGSTGILVERGYNCHVGGYSEINGYQNRAVGFTDCYYTSCMDTTFNSLEDDRTTTNFYGLVHEGGKYCLADRLKGTNIRRVSDTSAAGLSIYNEQQNIHGITCNGSAAGTHHAFNSHFENITSEGISGTGLVIRGVDNTGHNIKIRGDVGLGIVFGGGVDSTADLGENIFTGIDIDAVASRGIRILSNGSYELGVDIKNCQESGVQSYAEKLRQLNVYGKISNCPEGVIIEPERDNGGSIIGTITELNNIQLSRLTFEGSTRVDIELHGTTDNVAPAENVTITNNFSSSVLENMVAIVGGYFRGDSVTIKDNSMFAGSTAFPVVDLGELWRYSMAPNISNNNRFASAVESELVRTEQEVVIGRYDDITDIPDKTVILGGDVIKINNPKLHEFYSFTCTFSGTTGTITGVTGDITAGNNQLTLTGNSEDKVFKGAILTITGAGAASADLNTRVVSINGNVATLGANASTTVSGTAVNYRVPEIKGVGIVGGYLRATSTELSDASSIINSSTYKRGGLSVYNTTENRWVYSTGSGTTAQWNYLATESLFVVPS